MSRTWFFTLEGPSSTVDERTDAVFPFLIMTVTIIPNYENIFPHDRHECGIRCH